MATGKAVVINEHGGTDKLVCVKDFSFPAPKSGEVLVKLAATSVNPVDVYVRAGTYASKEFPKASSVGWLRVSLGKLCRLRGSRCVCASHCAG